MTLAKDIASITPGIMSVALVGNTMKMIPKDFSKSSKKKNNTKFLKGFTEIMIGVPLIGATSNIVAKL